MGDVFMFAKCFLPKISTNLKIIDCVELFALRVRSINGNSIYIYRLKQSNVDMYLLFIKLNIVNTELLNWKKLACTNKFFWHSMFL